MSTTAPVAEKTPPVPPEQEPEDRNPLRMLLVPALSLVAALFVGGIVIVFSDPDALRAWASFFRNPGNALSTSWDLVYDAYYALFKGSLGSSNALSETVVAATPLIFGGLSVAIAFRAGLFNIGAEGQILAGSLCAAYVGFTFQDLPAVVHLPLAVLAGFAGGSLWGFIPGFLKAKTGAHEVIMTIMLNFIALRFTDFLLTTTTFQRTGRADPISKPVAESARLPSFGDLRINLGIILALAAAALVWWLLFRSTIGFEFRAVGSNPSAAAYAGMGVGATYVLAMVLAGGLAGLGGTATLLGIQYSITPGFAGYGFDAIALALLGRSHPAGVVAAAFLFGVLRAGATGMQAATSVPVDIIIVIQALIIVFMAAPLLVREIFRIRTRGVIDSDTFSKSWAS
ncbi:MAG TPA: ABC transporter permease [Actinomycetota bacterium]|nr:ABC transporter permease [Actinomycetota bacterium]